MRGRGYWLASIRNAAIEREQAETRVQVRVNEALESGEVTAQECADVLGVSRATLYRLYRWTQQRLPSR